MSSRYCKNFHHSALQFAQLEERGTRTGILGSSASRILEQFTMESRTILPALLVATLLLGNGIGYAQGATEFVLVHGASHGAWCWYKVTTILQAAGYNVTALDMESAGSKDKISADSVTTIAQNSKPLLDYLGNVSGQVVLVGHSIGGVSISVAMEQYPAKISHAIFLSAVMPKNNQSAFGSIPPTITGGLIAAHLFSTNYANGINNPPTSITINTTVAPYFFYNKSPARDATLAVSLLDNQPYCTLNEALFLTAANYGSVRRFYVQTDVDNIWGPTGQPYVISNNPPEQTFLINGTDHSAFFSKPLETVKVLVSISKY